VLAHGHGHHQHLRLRRRRQAHQNPATTYLYDTTRWVASESAHGRRPEVRLGAGGLAYETDLAGNIQSVPLVDGLGSVRALTDGTGALIQTYRSDALGVPTATQGSSTQPFGFTGEQADPTGLSYLRAHV